MPSHQINIAAQTKNYKELAYHVNEALNNIQKELLETTDNYAGRTAAYWSIQKGSPECLGIMAKAGGNLHRACPHMWEVEDSSGFSDGCVVEPSSEDERLQVHHALNQTTLSFVTRTCCECSSNTRLKACSRCKLARYCSEKCQHKNWELHQLVCKRIQKGVDLVTVHKRIPDPAKSDPRGFDSFDLQDDESIVDSDPGDKGIRVCWEYYDIQSKSWTAYPKELNWSIEYVYSKHEFARYAYRPGCPKAEGVEEKPITCTPPKDVATNSICFSHMIDHHIYTGAGRKIRRRELKVLNEVPEMDESKCSWMPLCGALK